MRKATLDALFLTVALFYVLLFTGVLSSYPWMILVTYALAYLLAVVLRLRRAAHQKYVAAIKDHSLDEASQELSSPRTFVGLTLYRGNQPPSGF